jgi:hypothetical protein
MKPVQLAFEKRFEIHLMLQFVRLFLAKTTTARQPFRPCFTINCGKKRRVLNDSR